MTRQRGGSGGGGSGGDFSDRSDQIGTNGQNGGGRGNPLSPLEDMMRRKGIDEAWNALEEMQRQGITTDRFTISRMLMKTVGDGRGRWNPAKIYRGITLVEGFIRLQPQEADEVLFNALLDTCCRMKDLARLEVTVNRMESLQIQPSHVTLGILVKAYGQAGHTERVLQVWDDMAEQRRQANAVTFGCMIDACVKCGHMDKAIEIFQDMKRRRKHRNTILYTTLIKGYGMEKDLQNALALFKEMKEEGVPYNTITYNSIIDVCIKCSDVTTAEELLREMMAHGNNVEPDLITYSTLLKGYCHVGDLDRALQVAETIKACGLKCDELVYNTLMDGCVKANDLSAGIGLFAEMTQAGMKPSSITHSILVRLYQRNGYKGDAVDAVASLYQHHGLDRPTAGGERGGRGNGRRGGDKREKKFDNGEHRAISGGGGGGNGNGNGNKGNGGQNSDSGSGGVGGYNSEGRGGRDAGNREVGKGQTQMAALGGMQAPPGAMPGNLAQVNGSFGLPQQMGMFRADNSLLNFRESGQQGYDTESFAFEAVPMRGMAALMLQANAQQGQLDGMTRVGGGLYAVAPAQQAQIGRGMPHGSSVPNGAPWQISGGQLGFGDASFNNRRRPSFDDGLLALAPWAHADVPYPVLDNFGGPGQHPVGVQCGGPGVLGEY